MSASGGGKAIVAAFFANLGIAVAKFVAFLFTGAASMLAEGIHSVADASNQGLLLLGGRRARREATDQHPFGFGRERYFWAFVVSVVLFTLGGLFSIFEGVEKIRHAHELESAAWAIGVLVVAIVLETISLRTAVVEAREIRGERSWWAFVRQAKVPELPVVLLEDLGALLGLVFALVGVVLAALTHDARFDALGSIAIGLLLTTIAIILAVEMKGLLIGESATPGDLAAIHEAIEAGPNVRSLIELRTQHLGPDELLVAAKVEFERNLTFEEVAQSIDETERQVRQRVPVAFLYIEPDLYDRGVRPGGAGAGQ
ncbi:MAG: cation diffusion facilitator family transporter [Actinomycetota bacterium]|nr:cation diffusion facilitator family transporter [Actinomycetota bacterium]